jgi:hypothetical protein
MYSAMYSAAGKTERNNLSLCFSNVTSIHCLWMTRVNVTRETFIGTDLFTAAVCSVTEAEGVGSWLDSEHSGSAVMGTV